MQDSVAADTAEQLGNEQWLSSVVQQPRIDLESIAHSMMADGVDEGTACALAGVVWLRHRPEPIELLLQGDSGMELLEIMVRAARLMPLAGAADVATTPMPLDPLTLVDLNDIDVDGHKVGVRFTGDRPRLTLFDNVIGADECAALIELGRARLQPSKVLSENGPEGHIKLAVRSSTSCVVDAGDSEVVAALERRVSRLLQWPVSKIEELTITHYAQDAQFLPHVDWFDRHLLGHRQHLDRAGQRLATLIVYLNEVPVGGATVFPRLGIEVRPAQGAAVYFLSHERDGRLNPAYLHAGAPVASGEKWIATFWLREADYRGRLGDSGALTYA